jgi:hypothetical protein
MIIYRIGFSLLLNRLVKEPGALTGREATASLLLPFRTCLPDQRAKDIHKVPGNANSAPRQTQDSSGKQRG